MGTYTKELRDRLEEKIERRDGHWFWTGATNNWDRPIISVRGKSKGGWPMASLASKIIFEEYTETSTPLDHKIVVTCDERSCVNPDHMESVPKKTPEKLPVVKPRINCEVCGVQIDAGKYCKPCGEVIKRANGKDRYKIIYKKRRSLPLTCDNCGFEAVHPAQMDVDHRDGDRENDSESNFWLLCANCHRLKTVECQDWRLLTAKRAETQGMKARWQPQPPKPVAPTVVGTPFRSFPKKLR